MGNLSYLIQSSSDANKTALTEANASCFEKKQKHPEPVKALKKPPPTLLSEKKRKNIPAKVYWNVGKFHHSLPHFTVLTQVLWGLIHSPGCSVKKWVHAWPQQEGSSNQWVLKTAGATKAVLVPAEGLCWCLFSIWPWRRHRKTGRLF